MDWKPAWAVLFMRPHTEKVKSMELWQLRLECEERQRGEEGKLKEMEQ